MRHLLVLAAAAFLAVGCAGNKGDETGAAPDQGDATVTATDSATVTDTTTAAMPADTTAAMPADTSAVMTDTTTVSGEGTVGADSAAVQGEVQADTTSAAPADTTAQQ